MTGIPTEAHQMSGPLLKGFATLASTRVVVLALQFLSFAIMAATLRPPQLGLFIFAIAFASVFTVVTDFGFGATVARRVAQQPEDESWLLPNLAYLRLTMACGAYVLVIGALVVIGYGQATRTATLLASLTLFIGAFDGFQISQAVRLRMSTVALGGLVQAVIMLGGVILFRAEALGVDAYIVLDVASTLVNVIVVTAASIHHAHLSWRPRPTTWLPVMRAGLPLGLASAAISVYYRLDLIILGRLKSADAVGQYGAAYRFIDTLNVLPAMVVSVLGPVFSRDMVGKRAVLQRRYRQTMHLIWLLALPIGLIGAMSASRLLPTLPGFGHYSGAGQALAILAPGGALILIGTVLSTVLVSAGEQRRLLRVSLMVLVANVGLNLALIPSFSYSGAAVATVLSEAVTVGLSLRMVRRHVGVSWRLVDLARTVPAALVVVGVLVAGYAIQPAEQVALAIVAYAVCLVVTPALTLSDVPGFFNRAGPVTFVMDRQLGRQRIDELRAAWPQPTGHFRWIILGLPEERVGSVEPYDTIRLPGRHVVRLWRSIKGSSSCILIDLRGHRRALAAAVAILAGSRPVDPRKQPPQ